MFHWSVGPLLFLFSLSLWASPCAESYEKLVALIKTNGRSHLIDETFTKDRGLATYLRMLGSSFQRELLSLGPSDHLVDFGAGYGIAAWELTNRRISAFDADLIDSPHEYFFFSRPLDERPVVSAISYDSEMNNIWSSNRFNFMRGRMIEEIPLKEITALGKVKLGLDVYGGIAYSPSPHLILEKYMNALSEDGAIYIHLGVASHPDLTPVGEGLKVIHDDGRMLSFVDFLESIPGIQVEILSEMTNVARTEYYWNVRLSRRPLMPVEIPELVLVKASVGTPPTRYMRVKK